MKSHAKSALTVDVSTLTIASSVEEKNAKARRLSTDLRFVRRARQGNSTPKVSAGIVFDYESSLLYSTGRTTML